MHMVLKAERTGMFIQLHRASNRYSSYVNITAVYYRVRQKNLTILQHCCEWYSWRGEVVLERPSSKTQNISVAMERWSVQQRAFAMETYLKNNDCCYDSADISSALQYSSERQCR
jgi:hypothetical protein